MDLKELIELFGHRPLLYAQDVLLFILSPRRYMNKVLDERGSELVARLVFYYCVFVVIEIGVLSLFERGAKAGDSFVGLVIYEMVMPLLMVPWMFIVALVARYRLPLKASTAYLLTFKPVCMVLPVVAYGLFLMTEDYVFAIARGAMTLAYVVALVVLFPVIVGRSIKQKIALIALSCALVTMTFWSSAQLRKIIPPSAVDLARYTLIYDPIAVEYDAVAAPLNGRGSSGAAAYDVLLEYQAIVDAHRGGEHDIRIARSLFRAIDEWRAKSNRCDSICAVELDTLLSQKHRLRFATSRAFADLRINELKTGRSMLDAYSVYLAAPDSMKASAVGQSRVDHIKAAVARMENEASYRRLRYYLRRALLLYDQ